MTTKRTIVKIEALLNKYYEGETSSAEEAMLLHYLDQPNLPRRFDADKAILSHFAAKRSGNIKPQKALHFPLVLQWASMAAVTIGAIFMVSTLIHKAETNYAYINGERVTSTSLLQSSAIASLNELTTSQDDIQSSLNLLDDDDEILDEQLRLLTGY